MQMTAYEMRISDWSSDVCSSDLTSADIAEMQHCIRKTMAASEWRVYEAWDNKLHRAIAQATRNNLLLALFDTLNMVRRATVWGRLRTAKPTPDPGHHSFAEHDAMIAEIGRAHA